MRLIQPKRLLHAAMIALLAHASPACAQGGDLSITNTGQSQVIFDSPVIGELSGITYLGGDSYLVVSDTNGTMAPATITIDRATGYITNASISTPINLIGGSDHEAIAYDARDNSVLVTAEVGSTITRHHASDGSALGSINVPAVFGNVQANRGLESVSLDPAGFDLWTANEEAITNDGGLSTTTQGTIVRLQRFDAAGNASAQFGYQTDPHPGGLSQSRSGVSELVALPNGGLIAMERALGFNYRIRFYEVDFDDADDTTNIATLTDVTEGLAGKTLLHQIDSGFTNFEGVTIGPMLGNGDYALILVSDDGAFLNPQNLLTLRVSGLAIEGDLTGDFIVDQDDLAVVLGNWGESVSAGDRLVGDPSGDGLVGVEDLDTVLANWTAAGNSAQAANVPEPGVFTLSAGTLWALARRW